MKATTRTSAAKGRKRKKGKIRTSHRKKEMRESGITGPERRKRGKRKGSSGPFLDGVLLPLIFFLCPFFIFPVVPPFSVSLTSPVQPRTLHALGPWDNSWGKQDPLCKVFCATLAQSQQDRALIYLKSKDVSVKSTGRAQDYGLIGE
jgi:hypothetical protein